MDKEKNKYQQSISIQKSMTIINTIIVFSSVVFLRVFNTSIIGYITALFLYLVGVQFIIIRFILINRERTYNEHLKLRSWILQAPVFFEVTRQTLNKTTKKKTKKRKVK